MEYSDGVRPYILEWYYDIFLKAFDDKIDNVDIKTNSKGETLEEPRVFFKNKKSFREGNIIR